MRIQGSSRLRAGFGSGNYQHLAVLTSAEILRKTQGPLSLAASPGIQIAPDAQALGFPSCFFLILKHHTCAYFNVSVKKITQKDNSRGKNNIVGKIIWFLDH